GLEPLIGEMNAGWAVVMVMVTPLLWGLPVALMVAELSSAMPEEGGYYYWVRSALGDFWSVQEGWWTICYTAVDMAIYPVLFVNYLTYFFPSLALDGNGSSSWEVFCFRWLIAVLVIASALAINLMGARTVGKNALVSVILVLGPFLILSLLGIIREGAPKGAVTSIAFGLSQRPSTGLFVVGLSVVLWNYCGWDNISTFAGEVNNPKRNYPVALAL